jgi:RecB family exonuclease
MNEENFVKKQSTLIGLQDSNSLKNIFDLSVESSEESYLDFNLRWQSLSATPDTFFTSAHMSFNSDPLNASLFFIENSPQSPIMSPGITRADELQLHLAHSEGDAISPVSQLRLSQDKKGYEAQLPATAFSTLSSGDFENYAKCSFKLLASKGFRLRTDSQAALDLDNRDKGSLAHALFEYLLKNIESDFDESAISAFLDEQRLLRRLFINLDRIWLIQRGKFLTLAKKFYKAEKERAKIFSFEVERQVQFFFDMKKGCFSLTPGEGQNFGFNLRIDRVDTHKEKKYVIIYDYKSSENADHKSGKWLTDYQFQMLLYMAAMKLVLPENLSLKGSLYYYYKNFKVNTGLIDLNVGLNDFLFNKRNSSLYDENEREEMEKQFVQLTSEILARLGQGEFTTKPYEPVICNDCDWRKLCRAAHLN